LLDNFTRCFITNWLLFISFEIERIHLQINEGGVN
jgi:hypothetical protein